MANLIKMYESGIQVDPNVYSYETVKNNTTFYCSQCEMENKIPSEFYYYGNRGLLVTYNNVKEIKYNCRCSNGHYFIHNHLSALIKSYCNF